MSLKVRRTASVVVHHWERISRIYALKAIVIYIASLLDVLCPPGVNDRMIDD